MSSKSDSPHALRQCQFDQFEDRLVMTAQPLVEGALVQQIVMPDLSSQGELVQMANDQFNLNSLRQQYDLSGKGQTVVVIDSGIAWDHHALGNGFGAGNKVVGGWDFAENDANPYDDGPAGFHGTHVSGIIASEDAVHKGVAPGADLVALRVFDDQGSGRLEWVEQALRWVHEHKDAFANPITTVNLSLGTAWNDSVIPNWATLEDEFAQLESAGIFISVAAGNSFSQYLEKGLSYPAVSSHVVAVSSHDSSGVMSNFSQRDDKVLVAPGENIRSTVPNHLFGGSANNQFLAASGTSMAAPYLAGASALLREAFEFMGESGVNQQKLYNHFVSNADRVYDQITGGWYSHLNLQRAIASVMADDFGNTWSNPHHLGNLQSGSALSGTISRIDDVDTFSFVAGQTGRMTLTFETTHNMIPLVQLQNGSGTMNGNEFSFDVVAGQTFRFSIASTNGIGHYQVSSQINAAADSVNLGNVLFQEKANETIQGQQLYQMSIQRDGILTITGQTISGDLQYQLLNAQQQVIATGNISDASVRMDHQVQSGETYFLKVTGEGQTHLKMMNLVSLNQGNLVIHGTNGNDTITYNQTAGVNFSINSIDYQFASSQINTVNIYGHAGNDTLTVSLGNTNDTVSLSPNVLSASGSGYQLTSTGFRTMTVFAGGGEDTLIMRDSNGNDVARQTGQVVMMQGNQFSNFGVGFEKTYLTASHGFDKLELNGTNAAERFVSRDGNSAVYSGNRVIAGKNFDRVDFQGNGGNDVANLYDTQGDDHFILGHRYANAELSNARIYVRGVERINAIASSGFDSVDFRDSASDDLFTQRGNSAAFVGQGMNNFAMGFDAITATSLFGNDLANLSDTQGNDQLWMHQNQTRMLGQGLEVVTHGFQRVNITSQFGGQDSAFIYGSAGNDILYSDERGSSLIYENGKLNRAVGFERTEVIGQGGQNSSTLIGKMGYEKLSVNRQQIHLDYGNRQVTVREFSDNKFDGIDSLGEIVFADFSEGDFLTGSANSASGVMASQSMSAKNFGLLEARTQSGSTSEYEIGLVDYLFMLDGNWSSRR